MCVCVCVSVRNETSETWSNVTGTSVVITVDSESQYNASVSSWTRLGDGGVVVSISFTTLDSGTEDKLLYTQNLERSTGRLTRKMYVFIGSPQRQCCQNVQYSDWVPNVCHV